MTTRPPLSVYLYERFVAEVIDTGDAGAAIRYTAEALAAPAASRLSLSLPVQADVHHTYGPGGRWVRSLLPEGRALAWAVQEFGVPEDDRYGLIAVLGADVAGAVQILPPGRTPRSDGYYQALELDELAETVERAHEFGLGLNRSRGVRLSLAGVQDKVLLHRVDGAYVRPIDGVPSTVIVKPQPPVRSGEPALDGVPTNELLCLILARISGLRTAAARIEHFGQTPALVVERYDRRVDTDGTVHRIHQEDLLSALGQDPLLKYERPLMQRNASVGGFGDVVDIVARPGPSLSNMAELLELHFGKAKLRPFLEAVTFNVAIGNADAHARNYSVLLAEDGTVELAPLYDLICTRYWDHLDADAAQIIAGKDQIDTVGARDLIKEANDWGIPHELADRWVHQTLDRVASNVDDAERQCVESGGDPQIAAKVAAVIRSRLTSLR